MKWFKRIALTMSFVLLLGVSAVVGITIWEMPPQHERDYFSLMSEWNHKKPDRERGEDWDTIDRQFLQQAIELADKYPGSTGELAILLLADKKTARLPERQAISQRLVARIDASEFPQLVRVSGYGMPSHLSADVAAPAIWSHLRKNLDHPMAAWVACSIAGSVGIGSETSQPPPLFVDAAKLVAERYTTSSHVAGLMQTLGNGSFSPRWANQFEKLAERIYDTNQDRYVKVSALMALAEIAHGDPSRQQEAETRYRQLIQEFDGQTPYSAQQIEQMLVHNAQNRIESMQYASIGRPAPDLMGVDLNGRSMNLADYRGKVVVLSFWATWCGPCMKLIPHERELLEQYANEPFAIVGVNADNDSQTALAAVEKHGVSWSSFQDRVGDEPAISERWKALFPTVYLIDHQGIIRQRFSGNPTREALQEQLRELVATARSEQR